MYDMLHDKPQRETVISYGPIFPQSPTSPDVILASLEYFMKLMAKLGQETTIVTADQAIYDTQGENGGVDKIFPDFDLFVYTCIQEIYILGIHIITYVYYNKS